MQSHNLIDFWVTINHMGVGKNYFILGRVYKMIYCPQSLQKLNICGSRSLNLPICNVTSYNNLRSF